ncbi:MAG: 3-deoxy-D-manno-octulosonic acid transferase [Planctomycetes bacterium]|nr:3-deoxy-D-manno-octulosonic acid transferase [Planctomycetota bacterium]
MLLDLLYLAGITLGTPYILLKMATSERFRAGLSQRLGWVPERKGQGPCFWVHTASVGEVLTAKTLINAIEEALPGYDIVITTSTNTGFSVAKRNFADKEIFYFPLDLSWIIRKVFNNIKPACIVLIELEIWPNLLIAATQQGIPVVVMNGRISARSEKAYQVLSFLSREFARALTSKRNLYCARTKADAELFHKLGIVDERILVTGTMKYDNISTQQDEGVSNNFARLFNIKNASLKASPENLLLTPVIVGGSTHEGEEAALLRVYKTLRHKINNLRLILAPRHVERTKDVVKLIKAMGLPCVQKTHLDKGSISNDDAVILIDTVGDLAKIYSLASCVFIGKSLFAKGGQNVMEPAGLGVPVVCGPYMYNFKEEMQLLQANQAVKVINNEQELLNTIQGFLEDPNAAKEMGQRAKKVVIESKGATERNIAILKNLLEDLRLSSVEAKERKV